MKVKVLNKILSKKNYLLFCLIYTSLRFLLDNNNERITQFVFFVVSFLYLFYRAVDNYRCFIKKEMIISYLIVVFGAISVLVNNMIDMVSIRALLMLVINFIAIIIDDSNDDNYINTFETIVYSVLIICSIHSILCALFSITDIIKITNLGMILDGRLKGFTYMSGTGEVALIGLGSNIYLFEKIKYKKTDKLFYINLFLLIINILVIILAQSRCSLYSMFFCSLIYVLLKVLSENKSIGIKGLFKNITKFIISFLLILVILYNIMNSIKVFKPREFSLMSIERVKIWMAYLVVFFKNNIIFGVGPSQFVYIYRTKFSPMSLHDCISYFNNSYWGKIVYDQKMFLEELLPHNEYVRHLIMFGFAGIVLLVIFIVNVIFKIMKVYNYDDKNSLNICYLSIYYLGFPLISGLVENMLSFTNSPRYIENFTMFFLIGYIYKVYNEINSCNSINGFKQGDKNV